MSTKPVLQISNATFEVNGSQGESRTLWSNLSLEVQPHEFIAVIGSNGSGKTSLLKAILGQEPISSGTIKINAKPIHRGNGKVGYIPQHRVIDGATPLRARDLIRFGLDGQRFGFGLPSVLNRKKVDRVLASVDAEAFAKKTIGQLSGGELQRLRVGQAVIGEPDLILADEPLSALDLHQQKTIADLLDRERREHNAAVLFVTHDVNPILDYVDRVLYLANGKFKIGTPDEVLTSEVLTELYGTPVDVLRNQGRIVVVGTHEHDHHPDEEWN
ncbi:metal ABC transporter ATP-binding protein [Rhodoluna sp.]|jgi:zinc/manganese transport system ATP-binding protein|uniref:metal ABC transporter ATP-binding protein n=1 Tax=Rhodoluna sp. TaxID=1969481 RepID=UPI0025D4E0F2|nr:metal ABC transporter ATP-binding protein [Rhodoluna sp.]